MDYTGPSGAERVHVLADRGSDGFPDTDHSAVEGMNSILTLNVCMMISYLMLHLWQDLYEESQARVGALERQLAALQVAGDDDEEEEGAEEDAEDGAEGDDEDGDDVVEEDDGADDGGDDEEWQLTSIDRAWTRYIILSFYTIHPWL